MKIRCVIIDDEPLAITVIEEYVLNIPDIEVIAKFTNPLKAYQFLSDNQVDLIFIDIQMPDLSGLQLVNRLINKPLVIFTTAFSEFAIEGFRVDAIDFLLKPIEFVDFFKAVAKAKELIYARRSKNIQLQSNNEFLFIKSEYKLIRVNFSDIIYVKGMNEYVQFQFITGKPIMTLLSLKKLEEQLPPGLFMRVHKSYIVNLDKINMVERNKIIYSDGTVIPVSNLYNDIFQEFVKNNFLA